MSTAIETKTITIELTLTEAQLETLKKAARAKVLSLNEYLLEVGLQVAEEPLPPPEQIVLSERDWEIFISALENPPEPNEALKAAFKKHQEKYGKW
jgi:uncharacterized protein (DUF1778 family)